MNTSVHLTLLVISYAPIYYVLYLEAKLGYTIDYTVAAPIFVMRQPAANQTELKGK